MKERAMISTATNVNLNLRNLRVEEKSWLPGLTNLLNLPYVERTYWRGMTIYGLEDPSTHIYVVLKGRVKILRASSEGEQKIISIRYPGDIFGELALAVGRIEVLRTDEAVALDTTRVAVIRIADFWHAAGHDSGMIQSLMQFLTERLAEAHRQIESLVFDNNHRRLARALLALSSEASRAGESSVRLTHEELAELIGSTREVVTGMMIEFRQRGLIDYKRGDIRPNLPQLVQFLAENEDLDRRTKSV
ncbi:MAG TPA: Crp/Fnr family transcriptional regulator [Blastocatellia bacterium]|nr:Crp/Fnr family transcriptional regulator [Blastocatellia bacterium]